MWNKDQGLAVLSLKHVPLGSADILDSLSRAATLKWDMNWDNTLSGAEGKMTHVKKKDAILYDHNQDGIDRRGFLKCMAWAGTARSA